MSDSNGGPLRRTFGELAYRYATMLRETPLLPRESEVFPQVEARQARAFFYRADKTFESPLARPRQTLLMKS